MMRRSMILASASLAALLGCASKPPDTVGGNPDASPVGDIGPPAFDNGPQTCTPGMRLCSGNATYTCDRDGNEVGRTECPAGQLCFVGSGCHVCMPGSSRCNPDPAHANQTQRCEADGSGWADGPACTGEATTCVSGVCRGRCDDAALGRSYLGCDYWPTITANSQLGAAFQFAVVLSNPQTYAVTASITGGALTAPRSVSLAPGAIETVVLPWVQELVQFDPACPGSRPGVRPTCGAVPARSALRRNGAYHVHADGPIAAYQFNPLTFQSTEGYASYTNDASLLLPQGVLTQRYTVSTYPNWQVQTSTGTIYAGGFASVVAVTGETTTVTVRATAQIAVGAGVSPISPGSTATFTLQQGDVLQLLGTGAGDLTGTTITSSLPVAVFVGHDCTNVPAARPACDHLEEQLFPNETWGRDYVVSALRDRGPTTPSVIRVVSQADGNTLTYEPAGVRPSETLRAGQLVEFASNQSFRVRGTRALLVSQFMIGQGAAGSTSDTVGDPAMVFEVPVQQYRSSYDFYVPGTYPQNFINVVAPTGAALTMDATPLRGSMTAVGDFTVFTLPIAAGPHRIRSDAGQAFGIKVYGVAPYTSYMYPGGLDLQLITPG